MPSYLQDDDTAITLPSAAEDEDEFERQLQAVGPVGRARLPWMNPAIQPPIGAGSGPGPIPPLVSGPPSDAPPSGPDFAKLKQIYGERPALPKPRWWQNLAGGAAGFGAGWSNASGRTKNPIDINAMRENILYPGYKQKFEEWQGRLQPAEEIAKLKSQQQQTWWNNEKLKSEAAYKAAAAEAAKQHGAYWEHRASLEQNQWKLDPKTGSLYNTVTGEQSRAPETREDRYRAAKAINVPEDMAQYFSLQGNLQGYGGTLANPSASRNLNPQDILLHPGDFEKPIVSKAQQMFNQMHREPREPGSKPVSRATSVQIENRKGTRLARAEATATKRLAAGEDANQVSNDLTRDKQQAQDAYENEIQAAGGETEHHEYLDSGTSRQRQAPKTGVKKNPYR